MAKTDTNETRPEFRPSPARAGAGAMFKTVDAPDPNVGWTAQHPGPVPTPESLPGQVFIPEQLPDPEVARLAGLPPQEIPGNLVVEGDDAFSHPQGPNAVEAQLAQQREAIVRRLLSDDVVAGDRAADVTSEPDEDDAAAREREAELRAGGEQSDAVADLTANADKEAVVAE